MLPPFGLTAEHVGVPAANGAESAHGEWAPRPAARGPAVPPVTCCCDRLLVCVSSLLGVTVWGTCCCRSHLCGSHIPSARLALVRVLAPCPGRPWPGLSGSDPQDELDKGPSPGAIPQETVTCSGFVLGVGDRVPFCQDAQPGPHT